MAAGAEPTGQRLEACRPHSQHPARGPGRSCFPPLCPGSGCLPSRADSRGPLAGECLRQVSSKPPWPRSCQGWTSDVSPALRKDPPSGCAAERPKQMSRASALLPPSLTVVSYRRDTEAGEEKPCPPSLGACPASPRSRSTARRERRVILGLHLVRALVPSRRASTSSGTSAALSVSPCALARTPGLPPCPPTSWQRTEHPR